jgi:hypothetical protein
LLSLPVSLLQVARRRSLLSGSDGKVETGFDGSIDGIIKGIGPSTT